MTETTDIEKKNLEAHVELCAERYRHLETKLEIVEQKITGLDRVIREVHDMMEAIKYQRNAQNMSMAAAIISDLAPIAAWFATQFFTTL
jgi:phage shock protein A